MGDMVCALKGKIVLGVYPPLPLFHFSSTLHSSQEWYIIIFQNIFWHIAQVIRATSFSNLLAYIYPFLSVPLCSSAHGVLLFPLMQSSPITASYSYTNLVWAAQEPSWPCSNPAVTWKRHSTFPYLIQKDFWLRKMIKIQSRVKCGLQHPHCR